MIAKRGSPVSPILWRNETTQGLRMRLCASESAHIKVGIYTTGLSEASMAQGKLSAPKSDLSRKRLMDIYERLYTRFGPQDWWPGETTLEVCLGAILVQNTSWANAARAIGNLKKEGLLTEGALKKVRRDRLARLIRPARFFNMKAKRIKGFVAYLSKHFDSDVDNFLSLPTEELHEELMGLDGVGRETADSITLYAAGRPAFVVDAYTKRIFARLGHFAASKNGDRDYLALQESLTAHLPEDVALFNEYHALLVRLGHTCCRPTPNCGECPLRAVCPYPGDDAED